MNPLGSRKELKIISISYWGAFCLRKWQFKQMNYFLPIDLDSKKKPQDIGNYDLKNKAPATPIDIISVDILGVN